MPFIITVLGVIAAIYFYIRRARNTIDMTHEILDAANDVRLAARRFGFRRRQDLHPVESVTDASLAIGTIATAFIELSGLPTQDDRHNLNQALCTTLKLSPQEATEMQALGHWLMLQCGGATPAVSRVSRRLVKLGGAANWEPLLSVIKDVLAAKDHPPSQQQAEAIEDIKRAFRVT